MGRRLLLINAVTLIGIYFLARHVTASWRDYETAHEVGEVVVHPPSGPTTVVPPAPPSPLQPEGAFEVIADKDLFSPERRRPAPPDHVEEEPRKLAHRPSLNGVLNNQGEKQALLTVFESNQSKGTPRTVSLGDIVQGYTVTDISDTTLTLKWKDTDTRIVIDMFEAVPPHGPQKVPSPRIVTIGSLVAAVDAGSAPAGQNIPTTVQAPVGMQPGGGAPFTRRARRAH